MAHQTDFILVFVLALVATLHGTHCVEFVVTNRAETTPGGIRFRNELGVEYTKQTMASATDFIWRLFQQNTEAERKSVARVTLYVDDMRPDQIAQTILNTNEIQVSDDYINNIKGDIKRDFNGVLYHEMAHVWQFWNGPTGVMEGIADFVRLKAGYAPPTWRKPGEGDNWDQGYDVTALFLDYCNGLRNGFVAEFNKKLRNQPYNDSFFVELLGKPVGQLWNEYKAKYGN